MYLLNLLFDLRNDNGLFSDSLPPVGGAPPNPMDQSRSWLVLVNAAGDPVPELPAGIDPTILPAGLSWQIIGEVPLYIPTPTTPAKQAIGVRIAPIAGSAPPLSVASNITFVAAFGAAIPKASRRASPFKFNTANDVTTTIPRQGAPPFGVPNHGWFFRLGAIDHASSSPFAVDRYEFAVGAVITEGATTLQFGMDPEMDVGN
jgi:hypothetical protein